MSSDEFRQNGRSVSLHERRQPPSELRIVNAFLPIIGTVERVEKRLSGFAYKGFNAVCLTDRPGNPQIAQGNLKQFCKTAQDNDLAVFFNCGSPDEAEKLRAAMDGDDMPLNLYLNRPEDWLTAETAKTLMTFGKSANGKAPEIILGTDGDPGAVTHLFSSKMRRHLYPFSTSLLDGDAIDVAPFDMIEKLAKQSTLHVKGTEREIAVTGRHDRAFDFENGRDLHSYLGRHMWDGQSHVTMLKMLGGVTSMTSPHHMVSYADLHYHFHRQPNMDAAKPIDFDERHDYDAAYHHRDMNQTKMRLYGNGRRYETSEVSFCWAHHEHLLMVFYPKKDRSEAPMLVLMDAQCEREKAQPKTKTVGEIVRDLYARKGNALIEPEGILLLGEHRGVKPDDLMAFFPNADLVHNGRDLKPPKGQHVGFDRPVSTPAKALQIA